MSFGAQGKLTPLVSVNKELLTTGTGGATL